MDEFRQFDRPKKKKKKFVNMNLPGFSLGVRVPGPSMGDLEFALRKFKRIMKDSGVLLEYKDRREFLKPSVIKRRMLMKAKRNLKYDQEDYEES